MKFSLFKNCRDTIPVEKDVRWDDFIRCAKGPEVRADKDGKLVSPAIFSKPQRLNENVVALSALMVDLDHGVPSISEVHNRIRQSLGCAHVIYSTHSHRRVTESNPKAERRLRVVIPFKDPVPVSDFPLVRRHVIETTGLPADKAASALAQIYYTPVKATPDAPYEFLESGNEPLDWRKLDLPPAVVQAVVTRSPTSENGRAKDIDERVRRALAQSGAKTFALFRGDTSAFGGDRSSADLALANRLCPYSESDPRVLELMMLRSRLNRPKWHDRHYGDGRTYLQGLCDKALEGRTEYRSRAARLTEDSEWEQPAKFYEQHLLGFPVSTLPEPVCRYVLGLTEAHQVPVDLPAMLVLAMAASAVAGNVRTQARLGWVEPQNLYIVTVMAPGNRKSAVFTEVCEPLEQVERELIEQKRDEIARAASEFRMLEERKTKLEKEAAKTDNPEERKAKSEEAVAVAQQLAAMKVPVMPRLLVADVTPEVLATLLQEHGGRMGLFSPEGELFDMLAGRYSNGTPHFDVILKSHCGDPLRVDRRARAEYVQQPALTIGLTVQPDVICGLAEKPSFRGRGLLGRFIYSLPQSIMGHREIAPPHLPEQTRQDYIRIIKSLAQIAPARDRDDKPVPRLLYFTADANEVLKEFEQGLEPKLAEDGELGAIADWGGKLAGAVVRLAGILWLIKNADQLTSWPDKIDAETVCRAIEIGDYLIDHARAAFAEMGADAQIENAKRLLRWIEKNDIREFTRREAHQAHRSRFKTVDEIDPALALLSDHNYIRLRMDQTRERGPGRKASQGFEVNPLISSEKVQVRVSPSKLEIANELCFPPGISTVKNLHQRN